MSEQWADSDTRRGLPDGTVELARIGRVEKGPVSHEPYVLLDPAGEVVAEVSSWIRYLAVADLTVCTLRSYVVGRSTPLKTAAGRELARWLEPPGGVHPWPATVKGTTLDRFNRDKEPVALTLVDPLVVEVSADTAGSGRSFRHPLRVVRARPELSPAEIYVPEMLRPRR